MATKGRRGQKVAALHADPNRFLAAVQIGVTLAGFMSAAFGASAFADDLAPLLRTGAWVWRRAAPAATTLPTGWLSSPSPSSSPTCLWWSAS
jgi:putative hemolysin